MRENCVKKIKNNEKFKKEIQNAFYFGSTVKRHNINAPKVKSVYSKYFQV